MESFHKELNPKIWASGNELKPEVSSKLKEIAEAFISFLEIPKEAVKDIVITGSSASYNYTPYSDIDLHLIIDFEKVHKDCPIVQGYLLSKKSEFNKNHDISIYGIPIEVYAEAIDNENVHNGLYSLKQNKWVDEPKKIAPPRNSRAVNAKFKEFKEAAENVGDGEIAKQLIDKIKDMRKAGLSTAGEFSVENLVFKKLRNEGIIGKLMDIKKEKVDKDLSLEEALLLVEEMIHEVSVGKWARAAAAVKDERKAKGDAAKAAADFIKKNTSSDIRDYVKPGREVTKKGEKRKKFNKDDYDYDAYYNAQNNARIAKETAQKDEIRALGAKEVDDLNLPKDSKVSANKLTAAARSSWPDRHHEKMKKLGADGGPGSAAREAKRSVRAHNIKFADPNWARRNLKEKAVRDQLKNLFKGESLEEMYESLISSIEEMMGTSIAGMMDVQPNPVAGQEQPSKYQKESKHKEKPAMYKYNYQKVRRHNNMNIEEMIDELFGIVSEEGNFHNDYHDKKEKVKKAIKKSYPDILKQWPSGVDPWSEKKRAELEGKWEKGQDKQYQQDMKRGIGKGRLWNPTKNDKGDTKTRERSQTDSETGGYRVKSHDNTVKGSIRRNAQKNIKHLDKEIKDASREFDELYMKKQSNPNIDLHPAAHKEGNLRIKRDAEKERLAKTMESIAELCEAINEMWGNK